MNILTIQDLKDLISLWEREHPDHEFAEAPFIDAGMMPDGLAGGVITFRELLNLRVKAEFLSLENEWRDGANTIDRAYEMASKLDIYMRVVHGGLGLSEYSAEALWRKEKPLDYLYRRWVSIESLNEQSAMLSKAIRKAASEAALDLNLRFIEGA